MCVWWRCLSACLLQALHREKGTLEKEKAAKEADISVAQSRCVELQMLKFGQLIDIESLDQVGQPPAWLSVCRMLDSSCRTLCRRGSRNHVLR